MECLVLSSRDNADLVLPNPLLSGSVPRLRNLYLDVIALPALPPLLRSAKDLVHLHLRRIPGRGYILPEALAVTSLSAMTKLKFLHMHFASPASRPDPRSTPPPPPPPVGRGILPSLTHLAFQGAPTNTWRDVMARIGSTPSLSLSRAYLRPKPTFGGFGPRLGSSSSVGHAESTVADGGGGGATWWCDEGEIAAAAQGWA